MVVRNGSSRSTYSRRNVGAGSRVHDLTGDCIIMRRTSDWPHGLNDVREERPAVDGGGGGGPAVVARTSLTFFSKYSAKFSAV